jgi:uncharacterized iron-regulated membrane protein
LHTIDPDDSSWVIAFIPESGVWELGAFEYDAERFHVAQVDPRSGEVIDVIERPRRIR